MGEHGALIERALVGHLALVDGRPLVHEHGARDARRGARLTQQLLAFSRLQPLAPVPLDPNKLVSGMSELEFWPFQIANTASALIWAFVLLAPGAAVVRHFMG